MFQIYDKFLRILEKVDRNVFVPLKSVRSKSIKIHCFLSDRPINKAYYINV